MFNPKAPCYMTAEVNRKVSPNIRQLVLDLLFALEKHRREQMDYLQVFDIKSKEGILFVNNRQEQPPLGQIIEMEHSEKLNEALTIWAMWQTDHILLLFPSDF
jgi:hypothetical protein